MKRLTLFRVWIKTLLKNRNFIILVVLLALFAASTALGNTDVSILDSGDDKGAPSPDPNPF
ncbi:MAG: hypothetical protein DRJ37_01655 [Thermoprotei archaeon]|nr:MAG: hypothetical protein DRJ37_01655 [Thermoprotei archaeon]